MNLQDAKTEILEHFANYEVVANDINLEIIFDYAAAEFGPLDQDDVVTLLCNLEDQDLMQELIDGNFENFDPWNESIYDDYWSMSEDLNLHGESEEDED